VTRTPTTRRRRPKTKRQARKPIAVAITGGIGAGKSAALAAFARHGAAVVSSDEIVHRLLADDAEVQQALRRRFGDRVFSADGSVSRAAVAQIVFADRRALAWLEGLLHPRVVREYMEWREALADLPDPPALCVTEVPLLYEVGGEKRFDVVVAITAPTDLRARRTKVPLGERSQRLIPDEEKVRRADFSYVNDGSLEGLEAFVANVVAELTAQ
jgi:dephospho-CoA kinase